MIIRITEKNEEWREVSQWRQGQQKLPATKKKTLISVCMLQAIVDMNKYESVRWLVMKGIERERVMIMVRQKEREWKRERVMIVR